MEGNEPREGDAARAGAPVSFSSTRVWAGGVVPMCPLRKKRPRVAFSWAEVAGCPGRGAHCRLADSPCTKPHPAVPLHLRRVVGGGLGLGLAEAAHPAASMFPVGPPHSGRPGVLPVGPPPPAPTGQGRSQVYRKQLQGRTKSLQPPGNGQG